MGGIATEVQWKYRTISGAFLEAVPPPPTPLSLSPFLAKERNNLKDEFWWEMESGCSTRGSVDPNFAWNKRRGVVFKSGCVIPVFSASMCVCVLYICVNVWHVWWTEKNTVNGNEQKKQIKCYFIRGRTCWPWWEATVSQLCNLPPSFTSELHLPHRFPFVQEPWYPIPGSRWACYSDSFPKFKSSREEFSFAFLLKDSM